MPKQCPQNSKSLLQGSSRINATEQTTVSTKSGKMAKRQRRSRGSCLSQPCGEQVSSELALRPVQVTSNVLIAQQLLKVLLVCTVSLRPGAEDVAAELQC